MGTVLPEPVLPTPAPGTSPRAHYAAAGHLTQAVPFGACTQRRGELRSLRCGGTAIWAALGNLFTGVPAGFGAVDFGSAAAAPLMTEEESEAPARPFHARLRTQLARHPGRLAGACLLTVLAPAVVAHAGSLGPAQPAAGAGAIVHRPPLQPRPGDVGGWLVAARSATSTCPGLPSSVLVAIGQVETGLGARAGISPAGAMGPMQFLPGTWAAYGVDGDGDGRADLENPVDALYGAARLLCANGGGQPDRLPSAVWNYNHSDDYVRQVLGVARFVTIGY